MFHGNFTQNDFFLKPLFNFSGTDQHGNVYIINTHIFHNSNEVITFEMFNNIISLFKLTAH